MRSLPGAGHDPVGLDLRGGEWVDIAGSVADRALVRQALEGIDAVIHTATLHKPHTATHTREEFVHTNIKGTLVLLEEALAAGVGAVIHTSTTSAFGRALTPAAGEPAAWITEEAIPRTRNIYGATKLAAEELCELIHREAGLPIIVLRTSRFFPEPDDAQERRAAYSDLNLKVNELLHRRVDIEDAVSAHLCALERASALGFGRFIVSATTPFTPEDLEQLRHDAPPVVSRHHPEFEALYAARGWRMYPTIDRVYVNARARRELGWEPRHSFGTALAALAAGRDPRSELALAVGAKGYHDRSVGVYTRR